MQAIQAAVAVGAKLKATWLNAVRLAVLELQDVAVQRFATVNARDTAIPAPTNGMACIVQGIGQMTHDGTAWRMDGCMPCSAQSTATTQSIPSGAWTAVNTLPGTLVGTSWNAGSGITPTAGGFTVARAGVYLITMYGVFASNTTGRRGITAAVTVSSALPHDIRSATPSGTVLTFTQELQLGAGDAVRMWALQDSGGALDFTARQMTIRQVA